MEERTFDFTALSERISAQTQAYVEFSNALVKIIEQTASIRDSVNDTNGYLLEEYRELNREFNKLRLEVNNFFNDTERENEEINRDLESIRASLNHYEKTLNKLAEEFEKKNLALFKIIEGQVSAQQSNFDNFTKGQTSHTTLLTGIETKIDTLIEAQSSFKKTIDTFKFTLAGIALVVTLLETLIQFGVIKIDWL